MTLHILITWRRLISFVNCFECNANSSHLIFNIILPQHISIDLIELDRSGNSFWHFKSVFEALLQDSRFYTCDDPVPFSLDIGAPPGEHRFFYYLLCSCIFWNQHGVRFLYVGKSFPRRWAVSPFYTQLPFDCSLSGELLAPYDNLSVRLGDCLVVGLMIHDPGHKAV